MTTSEEGFVPKWDGVKNGRTTSAGGKMSFPSQGEGWKCRAARGAAGSGREARNWGFSGVFGEILSQGLPLHH